MVRALRTAYLEQNEISHNRDHTNGILRTFYRRYPLHMEYNVIKIMTNLEKTNDFVAINCDGNQSLYTSGSSIDDALWTTNVPQKANFKILG